MFSRVQPCYQKQVNNQAGKGFEPIYKCSGIALCFRGAPALQAGGHRFESGYLHHFNPVKSTICSILEIRPNGVLLVVVTIL